jgi:methyl-accepting chemotaxis protein
MKRIASEDYFQRYFSYSIIASDVSDVVLEQFLLSLEEKSKDELVNPFLEFIETKNVDKVISKLRQKSDKLPEGASMILAGLIAASGRMFPNPNQLFSFRGAFSQAAMLITNLLDNIQDREEKLNYAQQIIAGADPITFAVEITHWIRDTVQDARPKSLTSEEKSTLMRSLAEHIGQISSETNLLTEYPTDANTLLLVWANYRSKDETSAYLEGLFNQDPKLLNILLNSIVPTSWEMGSGRSTKLSR